MIVLQDINSTSRQLPPGPAAGRRDDHKSLLALQATEVLPVFLREVVLKSSNHCGVLTGACTATHMALPQPRRASERNTVNSGSELGLRYVLIIQFNYINSSTDRCWIKGMKQPTFNRSMCIYKSTWHEKLK